MMSGRNRRVGVALTAGCFFVGSVAATKAAEIGFFEALFGGGRPISQAVQPSADPGYDGVQARMRHRRASNRRQMRVRYAALPASEPLKVRITDRQLPIDMKGGAVAALLKDETLRPGDIVVLHSGAKVFMGDPDEAHALSDFVPIERSRSVDRATRRQLAVLMAPAAALPADQARMFVSRLKSPPRTPAALVPTQAAIRVINPWVSVAP